MGKTFKEVEPFTVEGVNGGDVVLARSKGHYLQLDSMNLRNQDAIALRDWLNKALGEPHE